MKSLKSIFVSLLSCTFALHSMGEVLPKVTFVTPSIVRVQWSPKGEVRGNETGVCIYEPKQVKVQLCVPLLLITAHQHHHKVG